MDVHVHLNVPPATRTARLLRRNRRWGLYFRARPGDAENRVEFRQIDPGLLRLDDVDPTDVDVVIAHVEDRLKAAGYDTTRLPDEGEPVAAGWEIEQRGDA